MNLRSIGVRLIAPAVLFVACCGVYWKLVLSGQYTWLDSPDLVRMEVPRLQYQRVAFKMGEFPLWDPYQWCGQPFLGQVTGAAFPGNWLFSLLPFNREGRIPFSQYHWYFFLIHWLGGLFAYWLCRDLGSSRAAAILGGMVFAFNGFFNVNNWPVVMAGVMWAPLVFLFLIRALRGVSPRASAALCGVFLGIAWLAGHHEIPTYLTVAVGGVWAWYILMPPEGRSRWEMLGLAVLTLAMTAMAGGMQLVTAYEYGLRARRWAGGPVPVSWKDAIPYSVHSSHGWKPSSLPGLFIAWFAPEINPYLGVIAVTLAVAGAIRRWQERAVRVLVCVGAVGALLAMSGQNIAHGFLYAVLPVFGKARHPMRITSVVDFVAAPLAAFGFDALLSAREWSGWRRVTWALVIFGGGIYLIMSASRIFGVEPRNEFTAFTALLALLLAGLVTMLRRGTMDPRVLVWVLGALLVVDMGIVASSFPERQPEKGETWLPNFDRYRDIVEFLKKQPQPLRVFWTDETQEINLGDWDGIDSMSGFSAAATMNLVDLEMGHLRQQDLLAINYTVARKSRRDDDVMVYESSTGFKVFRNPSAFPRTWTVHDIFHAKNNAEVIGRVREYNFDLRTNGVMTAAPPELEKCAAAGEESRVAGRTMNTVTLESKLACRGMVILSETYFPGWSATVDGKPAVVHEVYGSLQGVVADAGAHRIELRYRPWTAILGTIMTFGGVLIGVALWAIDRRYSASS